MPLNPDAVGTESEPTTISWTSKDALLYAVSLGAARTSSPTRPRTRTASSSRCCRRYRSCSAVAAVRWRRSGSFNPALLVHGQQAVTLHKPLPVKGEATVVGQARRDVRQGQGRRRRHRGERDRRQRRPAAVHDALVGLHPWRGRLGRRPRSVRRAERAAGAGARPSGDVPDVAGPGLRLPPQRRPQPAPHRSVVRGDAAASTGRSSTACARYGFTGRALLQTFCGNDVGTLPAHRGPLRVTRACPARR